MDVATLACFNIVYIQHIVYSLEIDTYVIYIYKMYVGWFVPTCVWHILSMTFLACDMMYNDMFKMIYYLEGLNSYVVPHQAEWRLWIRTLVAYSDLNTYCIIIIIYPFYFIYSNMQNNRSTSGYTRENKILNNYIINRIIYKFYIKTKVQ